MTSRDRFTIAAAQATPVYLDREATIEKACSLIAEVGGKGARLVVFPECFVPGYPLWVWFIPPARTQDLRVLYHELLSNGITVPGPETDQLCAAARKAGVAVTIGVNERNAESSGTTLFNTLLFIGPDGSLLGRHRKLMPTVGERLVHGFGDGSSLDVYDLPFGRVCGLTCWENYMPLARFALYAKGPNIHVAPTWDRGEPWISTLRHVAKEGRVYVVGCCSAMKRDDVPDRLEFKEKYLPKDLEWINSGDTTVVDPDGKFVVEPVRNREEIVYAEIDPTLFTGPAFQFDSVGHYARPDIFQLYVNRSEQPVVVEVEADYTGADTFNDEATPEK